VEAAPKPDLVAAGNRSGLAANPLPDRLLVTISSMSISDKNFLAFYQFSFQTKKLSRFIDLQFSQKKL
jgi:hypothetical protein